MGGRADTYSVLSKPKWVLHLKGVWDGERKPKQRLCGLTSSGRNGTQNTGLSSANFADARVQVIRIKSL